MNELPADLPGFLTLLFAGSGVVFGFLVVWLTNQVIALWEARHPGQSISATKRRWISLGVPAALVFVGYAGLVLLGTVPLTGQTLYLAAVNAVAAAGFKQIAFATVESAQKPSVTNNIGSINAAGDAFLGSTINRKDDQP